MIRREGLVDCCTRMWYLPANLEALALVIKKKARFPIGRLTDRPSDASTQESWYYANMNILYLKKQNFFI